MENGIYKTVMTDFSQYIVAKFIPHLYNNSVYSSCSCGANTLALLTGDCPFQIEKKLKYKNHTDDKVMIAYLKKRKFKVIPITKAEMTPHRDCVVTALTGTNVILVSALFAKNEASWGVLYDETFYHNFQMSTISGLTFLNRPILSAYCLYHPEWSGGYKTTSYN